jgi:hypothetical protein
MLLLRRAMLLLRLRLLLRTQALLLRTLLLRLLLRLRAQASKLSRRVSPLGENCFGKSLRFPVQSSKKPRIHVRGFLCFGALLSLLLMPFSANGIT